MTRTFAAFAAQVLVGFMLVLAIALLSATPAHATPNADRAEVPFTVPPKADADQFGILLRGSAFSSGAVFPLSTHAVVSGCR